MLKLELVSRTKFESIEEIIASIDCMYTDIMRNELVWFNLHKNSSSY